MLITRLLVETSSWGKADVIAAIVTSGLFVLVLAAQVTATLYTRRAANAAKESANEARSANERAAEEMSIRLRPWVGFRPPQIEVIKSPTGDILASRGPGSEYPIIDPTWPEDSLVFFTMPITNYGQFPAVNAGVASQWSTDRERIEKFVRENAHSSTTTFWPHDTFELSFEMTLTQFKLILPPDPQPIYFACSVVYGDKDLNLWIVEALYSFAFTQTNTIRETLPEPFFP